MNSNKKIILTALILIVIILGAAFIYPKLSAKYSDDSPYQSGQIQSNAEKATAPDFEVLDMDGNTVKLSDYYGKPIVINFWATWCGYCVQELPAFDACATEYGDSVTFMMVDLTDGVQETVEVATSFAKKQKYTFPMYFDTRYSAAESYGIRSIPMTVFIDKDGNVYHKYNGIMKEATLKKYIKQLIGEVE